MVEEFTSKNHIHTFVRLNKNQYKCADPTCTAVFPKKLLYGKKSICAVCGEREIILSAESLRRARPRCIFCSTRKDDLKKIEIIKGIENLMEGN